MRFLLLLSMLVALVANAQETPAPVTPPPRRVALRFAPPPLAGTISLGIYDRGGKLVRVLHREDAVSDFTAGHDALETSWDGNDDAGQPLPASRYHARGFVVGDLQVEGVGYFFNDWVTDEDSPHIAHISRIEVRDNLLALAATTVEGKSASFVFDPAGGNLAPAAAAALPNETPKFAAAFIDPLATALGKDGTIWGISHVAKGGPEVEIVQLAVAPNGEVTVLRKLAVPPGEPQPVGLAASLREDRIFLREQSPALERVRSLSLQATKNVPGETEAISDWKVDFEKKIVAHQNFALAEGKAVATPNDKSQAPAAIAQKLRPNPLERDRPGQVVLAVGFDAEGSYLATSDGLPLRSVSENGQVHRALFAPHGENAVDFFQDDGAVVEQFRLSRLDQMMAFDCGEFELR